MIVRLAHTCHGIGERYLFEKIQQRGSGQQRQDIGKHGFRDRLLKQALLLAACALIGETCLKRDDVRNEQRKQYQADQSPIANIDADHRHFFGWSDREGDEQSSGDCRSCINERPVYTVRTTTVVVVIFRSILVISEDYFRRRHWVHLCCR